MKITIGTTLVACLMLLASVKKTEPTYPIQMTFIDHLKGGMLEQDVFVEKEPGSGLVYRALPEERDMYWDAPAFASARAIPHNPYIPKKAGPYLKGEYLGKNSEFNIKVLEVNTI